MSRTEKVELRCDRCGKTETQDKATVDGNTLESLGWVEEPAIGSGGKWLLCQACDAEFRTAVSDCMAAGKSA